MQQEPWYTQFDFKENPLSIKPALFQDELIGYEEKVDCLIEELLKGSVWFIGGKYGTGKTTILKKIINEFRGQGRLIYLSLNRTDKSVDFEKIIKNRGNFFQRLFGIKPKNCILLIDEAQRLTKKDCEHLLYFYEHEYIQSIIFVTDKFEKIRFTEELKELIGKNILHIGEISPDMAVDLIRKRIGDLDFISDKIIKLIFEKSKRNPRLLLENTEDIFKAAHDEDAKKITEKHISKVFLDK